MRTYITGLMTELPTGTRPLPPWWAQWGALMVWGALFVIGVLFVQAQRLGGPQSSLPAGHPAFQWSDWVVLAEPAPAVKAGPLAPPEATGEVVLSDGDLALLASLNRLKPPRIAVTAVPDPFPRERPPAVPGIWEPLAQLRARQGGGGRPLVVVMRQGLALSPFQSALSWSDPAGLLIVISRTALGEDSAVNHERLRKLLLHEYGHLAGCGHHAECVMAPIRTPEELDALPSQFCDACRELIGKFPHPMPAIPDPAVRRVDPLTGEER